MQAVVQQNHGIHDLLRDLVVLPAEWPTGVVGRHHDFFVRIERRFQ